MESWVRDLKGRHECTLGPPLWETEKKAEHVELGKVKRRKEREVRRMPDSHEQPYKNFYNYPARKPEQ